MWIKRRFRRKLSFEILLGFALCFVLSALLFMFVTYFAGGLVEEYCFYNDIYLTEDQFYRIDTFILGWGFAVSAGFFSVLFLVLFGTKFAYIRTITKGVDSLSKSENSLVPLKGNNELTQLAEAVNLLSQTQRDIREKEQRLSKEKEEFIRALSHDIRTPLTFIISYTDLVSAKGTLTDEEQKEYINMVSKKAGQIKELTDILLDGGERQPELFTDGKLLFAQLAEEFEELLEGYTVSTDISGLQPFSGRFVVRELQRIFDNLASNIKKYAREDLPVYLLIQTEDGGITIRQRNSIKEPSDQQESYRVGINSIRRIAQNYGGSAETQQNEKSFEIIIKLSHF